jgi:delta-1-pyrroline-5-carboxylate synthetase
MSCLQACKICVDAKIDYPAACNAVEKILVHRAHHENGNIFQLQKALRVAGVEIYGTQATTVILGVAEAPSLRHEYGTPELTLDLVEDMEEAIEKIHTLGSGHTEVRSVDKSSSCLQGLICSCGFCFSSL